MLTKTWSKVSGPGTVTFGNASQPSTSAIFSADGSYLLRLTANDGALQATSDITVSVGAVSAAWTGQNIANATPAGSFSESNGTFNVRGGGANITGASDQFYFVTQTLAGDGEIRARVVSMSAPAASAKVGVMLRNDTTAGSGAAFMSLYSATSSNGQNTFRTRASGGSYATSTTSGAGTFPKWIRLVRAGNTFAGYTSPDGQAWTQVGATTTLTLNSQILVGLAVTSNNTSTLCNAVFDNVSVTNVAANIGPTVDAGGDASLTLPAPASLHGNVTDDGKPLPASLSSTWVKASGPGTVTFADGSDPITSASFSAPGNYVLRLIADDGQIKTFDDVSVSTALPSISVQATVGNSAEVGPVSGRFTITRSGSSDFALAVRLAAGGTATDGVDALALPESVTLPIGSSTATVDVTPMVDTLAEGEETIVLSVLPDSAYLVGSPSAATVTIADSPADGWRFSRFGVDANLAGIAGDNADPDGDGLPNLYEYGAGFEPLTMNAESLEVGVNDDDLTLIYRRRADVNDLTYRIDQLDASGAWESVTFTESIFSDEGSTKRFQAHVPIGGATSKIIRLRITRP